MGCGAAQHEDAELALGLFLRKIAVVMAAVFYQNRLVTVFFGPLESSARDVFVVKNRVEGPERMA